MALRGSKKIGAARAVFLAFAYYSFSTTLLYPPKAQPIMPSAAAVIIGAIFPKIIGLAFPLFG
jgi:hypothetical protein